MKNRLLFFSFVFLSLFLCCGNVSAKTKVGINIDANQHFNYYYEQRESTPFYDIIRNLALNKSHVYDYFGVNENQAKEYNLYSFYSSDLQSAEMKKYSREHSDYWLEDVSIPDNSYYALVFVYSSYNSTSFPAPITSIDGNNYSVNYQSYEKNNNNYANGGKTNSIIRFYDEQGNYISNSEVSNFYFNYTTTYSFDDYDDKSSADFTYMLSSCISCYYKLGIESKKIVITDIIEDNTHYLIDDNDNYSGWLRKLFSFGKLKYTSVVDTDLNYFKTNVIQAYLPTISNVVQTGIRSYIPDNYQKVSLGDDVDNYLFIPKNTNDNTLNRKFFSGTNEGIHHNLFKVGLNVYDLTDNYNVPYDESKLALISFAQPLKTYQIDIENYLNKLNNNYNITDFAVSFGLFGNSAKYSADIYYNPDSYTICSYSFNNDSSCSFKNPITGEDVTLNKDQVYNILSQNNKSGASVNIYDEPSEQCKVATEYSDLYEYDDNCNIIGMKQNSGINSILESLNSIKNFLSGFVSIITTIFSYVVLLLDSLPLEIKSVLLFGLIGGTIITLYKIIRG